VNATAFESGACSLCGYTTLLRPIPNFSGPVAFELWLRVCFTCIPSPGSHDPHEYTVVLTQADSDEGTRARVFRMTFPTQPWLIADVTQPCLTRLRATVLAEIQAHQDRHYTGMPASITITVPDGRFSWRTVLDWA